MLLESTTNLKVGIGHLSYFVTMVKSFDTLLYFVTAGTSVSDHSGT